MLLIRGLVTHLIVGLITQGRWHIFQDGIIYNDIFTESP